MIIGYNELKRTQRKDIRDSFEENHDFKLLLKKYPQYDYYVLFIVLYATGRYNKDLFKHLCRVNIGSKKHLYISDTHTGSYYSWMGYVYKAIEFGLDKGIEVVFHGGDIIQAQINKQTAYSSIDQAYEFIENYPFLDDVKTYAIFGNHDYDAIKSEPEVEEILKSREDIDILGFKKAFIKWNGSVIGLKHEIEKYHLIVPYNSEFLSFVGHSHYYHVKESYYGKTKIYIPSASNDPLPYTANTKELLTNPSLAKPGFLISEVDGHNAVISHYVFNGKRIDKENEYVKPFVRK